MQNKTDLINTYKLLLLKYDFIRSTDAAALLKYKRIRYAIKALINSKDDLLVEKFNKHLEKCQ